MPAPKIVCGVGLDGRVKCWGVERDGGRLFAPVDVAFTSVSAGVHATCGVRESDNRVQCWGNDGKNMAAPP